MVAIVLAPSLAPAQITYFNTDAGRPVRIEDALSIERYLLDLHLAPIEVAVPRDGSASWRVVPEATYGIVPRTQVSLALPVAYHDDELGLAGVNVSALYNLNAETRRWPALGVRGSVLVPAGSLSPERTYGSLKAIVTRTFDWARVNVNGGYTFGSAPLEDELRDPPGVRRWIAGVSADRSFPTKSLLATLETFAEQPLDDAADIVGTVGVGLRYQLTTHVVLDAGVGAAFTGDERPVFVTVGLARAQAVKTLLPGFGRWGR